MLSGEEIRPVLKVREEPLSSAMFNNSHQTDTEGNTIYDYYVDEEIVSKEEEAAVVDTMCEVFDLTEEINFDDTENYSFDDMMVKLGK